jgi:hypothetical protein
MSTSRTLKPYKINAEDLIMIFFDLSKNISFCLSMEKMIKWLINPSWPPIHKMYSKMLQKLTSVSFTHLYHSQADAGLKDTLLLTSPH